MDQPDVDWTARTAAALCVASRWLAVGALVLTMTAFGAGLAGLRAGVASASLVLIVLLGATQVYLAVRIEFDRRIFELVGPSRSFDGFDAALRGMGLERRGARERSTQERAAGLVSLIRWSGRLLAAQFVLAVLASSLPQ
ncbi:MAG TPA: hypothetical protein VEQ87_03655 [Burkholderiales bacterium]|nr:hypothetical protein [Burkholderiales bacterium]